VSELQHSGRGGGEAVILVHNSIEISSPFRSSDAHPVHLKQYFHLMEHYTNRINLIRGPTHFIDLCGPDPPRVRSEWLIVTSRNREPVSLQMVPITIDLISSCTSHCPPTAPGSFRGFYVHGRAVQVHLLCPGLSGLKKKVCYQPSYSTSNF